MSSPIKKKQVLVCQRGSRHRYSIPRLLDKEGLLAALYTDSCAYSFAGRFASLMEHAGLKSASGRALISRIPEGIDRRKVYSSDGLLLPVCFHQSDYPTLSSTFRRRGLQGADVVYSMCGEEFEFLEWAKGQGAKLVVDVFIHPGTSRSIAAHAESIGYPNEVEGARVENEEGHFKRTFEIADILLCPSQWVAEGVRQFSPESSHKIRVIPYGSSLEIQHDINTAPQSQTILFAGRDPLRKGLHILAEAASIVHGQFKDADFRVAGISKSEIGWIKHREDLNCLGAVPMDQMREEYRQATMFVLPSFSEGQAGVLLEAMACGCPVVATRESGVDFLEGAGVTVPAGDPVALAGEIMELLDCREKRNALARGALLQAADFSMSNWRRNLVDLMKDSRLNGGGVND